jgi:hypothetical protein
MTFSMDNYIDVAERIKIAKEQFPDMSLQAEIWFDNIDGQQLVICKAKFYRTPEDVRPGVGHASEPFPGKTPYTKGSEIMNAETSAWGRAIAAVIPMQKVASANEVKLSKERQKAPQKAAVKVPDLSDVKIALHSKGALNADTALSMANEAAGTAHTNLEAFTVPELAKIWSVYGGN